MATSADTNCNGGYYSELPDEHAEPSPDKAVTGPIAVEYGTTVQTEILNDTDGYRSAKITYTEPGKDPVVIYAVGLYVDGQNHSQLREISTSGLDESKVTGPTIITSKFMVEQYRVDFGVDT